MGGYIDQDKPPNELVQELGRSFEGIGFAVIVNHGIPAAEIKHAYEMSRTLFHLPDDVLKKYEDAEGGRQRGFASFGTEQGKDAEIPDLKRFWHIGLEGVHWLPGNVWPSEVPNFRKTMLRTYHHLRRLGNKLLDITEEYLGYEPGTLSPMVEGGDTILRMLHYPEIQEGWRGIRAAAHEDINLITLLIAATASGLEVKTREGKWIEVQEQPDSIVVNVGDMLQLFSGGRLISTTHRVRNSDRERFSMPYFIHPRPEVVLHKESNYTAGEYLERRLVEIKVKKGDLSKMRAVPTPG